MNRRPLYALHADGEAARRRTWLRNRLLAGAIVAAVAAIAWALWRAVV